MRVGGKSEALVVTVGEWSREARGERVAMALSEEEEVREGELEEDADVAGEAEPNAELLARALLDEEREVIALREARSVPPPEVD